MCGEFGYFVDCFFEGDYFEFVYVVSEDVRKGVEVFGVRVVFVES